MANGETDESAKREQGRPVPVTTILLMLANVLVFAAQIARAGGTRFLFGGGTSRDAAIWSNVLRSFGANHSTFTIADSRFETLVTSTFLHGSILHIGFNLLVLWQVGPFLERSIGRARYLPLYLGAGILGSAFSAIAGRLFGPSLSVGASGSICGLIGAILVLGGRTQGWRGPLARQMAAWLAVLVLLGLARNLQGDMVQVDNAAHLGGALGGMIIAALWRRGYTYSPRAQASILGACTAVIVLSGVVAWVRGATDPYLWMGAEERYETAASALRNGRCEAARVAAGRARRMIAGTEEMRVLDEELARTCPR